MEQQKQFNIKPSDLVPVECESCGGRLFREVTAVYRVPKLLVGAPKDVPQYVPIMRCDDCGHINAEYQKVLKTLGAQDNG